MEKNELGPPQASIRSTFIGGNKKMSKIVIKWAKLTSKSGYFDKLRFFGVLDTLNKPF
jgi:hypothetical protein